MRKAIVAMVLLGFFAAVLADGCSRDEREVLPTGTVMPGETRNIDQTPKATSTPDPNATPFPTNFYSDSMGEYSYSAGLVRLLRGNNCSDGDRTDPITVVFDGGGVFAERHAENHGMPEDDNRALEFVSGGQYFWDRNECSPEDLDQAESSVFESRFHMRGRTSKHPEYPGTWSVGTPHFDLRIISRVCHAVPELYARRRDDIFLTTANPSGFDAGRDWILSKWVDEGPHEWIRTEFWGNIGLNKQCNNDLSGSDGYVDFIEIERATD